MAGIKAALAAHLRADPDVQALVAARVWHNRASSTQVKPYMTIQRVADQHVHHMSGASLLARTIFDINCWDVDGEALETLADTVRKTLDTFSGTLGSGTSTIEVQDLKLTSQSDESVLPVDGGQVGIYRVRQSYDVWAAETAPTP